MPSSKTPRPLRIALLVETSTKIGRDFVRGVQDYAHRHGSWSLDLQPGGLNQVLPHADTWKGAGIIARAASPSLFSAILKTRLPTAFFTLSERQRRAVAGRDILEVFVEAGSVGRLAAEHLKDRGFARFGFVGSARDPDWSKRRERAFAQSLGRDLPLHVYPNDPRDGDHWATESRRMVKWLARLPKPAGILAANDARGLQVIDACRQAGLAVPDEVAVVGADNDELICSICNPPLTSITLDAMDAGFRTMQALHALILKRPPASREIRIPAIQVVARKSTATAVAHDERVRKARQFILRKAHEMIQVGEVAEHVGISRRSLETHFAKATGRSLLKEIVRVRIERAKTLLLSSSAPVHAIAAASGFSDANYMCKVFKKAVGCSPHGYRTTKAAPRECAPAPKAAPRPAR